MGFSFAPGALAALGHAGQHDPGYTFTISGGGLGHMSSQYAFLRDHGFDVGRADVYPALRTQADYDKAVKAIWEFRIAGWNSCHDLFAKNICTQQELDEALDVEIARSARERK